MIVAGFGDPELRGEGAGVRLPGTQAHIRTHRASLGEAGWVFDGKEEVSVVKSICRFPYTVMCRSRASVSQAMASPPLGFTWSFNR